MPVRKSQGLRRGIPNGVQRSKIRSQPLIYIEEDWRDEHANSAGLSQSKARVASKILRALASQWAQTCCFDVTSSLCCTLCIVPFIKHDYGQFQVAPVWRRSINAMIMAVLFVTCMHKLVAATIAFTIKPIGIIASVLSYAGFHLQMTTMSVGTGLVFMPYLSCELLNSWSPTISQSASRLSLAYRSPRTYVSSSLQVLSTCTGSGVAITVFPALSFVFPTAPIFLYPLLKDFGVRCGRDDWLTELAVQLSCYVCDVSIYAACLLLMCFTNQLIVSEIGFQKVLLDFLR